MVHFTTYAYPLYSTFDLRHIGYTGTWFYSCRTSAILACGFTAVGHPLYQHVVLHLKDIRYTSTWFYSCRTSAILACGFTSEGHRLY